MRRGLYLLAALLLAGAPAFAAADGTVIFPASSPAAAAAESARGGFGPGLLLAVLLLAAAGGWLLWRSRAVRFSGRDARLLAINETRSLGNRQFLVVASYDGKKFLLGVCPGRIELLAPLNGGATGEGPAA
jgi:flagellar protein FliO/FliZ